MDSSWWRASACAVKINGVGKKWNLTSNLANVQADHTSETARGGIVIDVPVGIMTRRDAWKMTQTSLAVERLQAIGCLNSQLKAQVVSAFLG